MMKKLAVTVFVLSLAAVGCGSDSGTPVKKDGSTDLKVDAVATPDGALDAPIKTDLPVGPETQADKPADMAQPADTKPVDGAALDSAAIDGPATGIDGAKKDAPIGLDGAVKLDAGTTEAGPAVDAGAVDGGSRG